MRKILAIDDDPVMHSLLARILVPQGYSLTFAADVAGGFQACLRGKPDLVLLDVGLPDGNGEELCRRIKSDPELRHIPVLMLTGEAAAAEDRHGDPETGPDDYIHKPFNPPDLISRIRKILSQ